IPGRFPCLRGRCRRRQPTRVRAGCCGLVLRCLFPDERQRSTTTQYTLAHLSPPEHTVDGSAGERFHQLRGGFSTGKGMHSQPATTSPITYARASSFCSRTGVAHSTTTQHLRGRPSTRFQGNGAPVPSGQKPCKTGCRKLPKIRSESLVAETRRRE